MRKTLRVERFPLKLTKGSASGFIGVAKLKEEHAKGLHLFRAWVAAGTFESFHRSHYDWWMFPIDEESGRGAAYTLSPADCARVRADEEFILAIREGVKLLMLAWGWDVDAGAPIADANSGAGQKWTGYAVRLWKAGRCLLVLHQDDLFAQLHKFAHTQMHKGDKLTFSSSRHARAHCVELWQTQPMYE